MFGLVVDRLGELFTANAEVRRRGSPHSYPRCMAKAQVIDLGLGHGVGDEDRTRALS